MANDNFQFDSEKQYPKKTAPLSRQIYDIIRQIQTVQGVKGDIPSHEWNETRVRFENPDGTWGSWVDLVAVATAASEIQAEYSIDGLTNWHVMYSSTDKYFRHSYDGGDTWSYSVLFKGDSGDDGDPGTDAPNVIIEFSLDGLTDWHVNPISTDVYFRFSNDDGVTYTDAVYFKGNPGDDGITPDNAPNVSIQYSADGSTYHETYVSGTDKYIRFSVDDETTWTVSDQFIGSDGVNAYLYVAWADDDSGNGFTTTFSESKNYRAEIQSTTVITSPVASNFAGNWKYIVGSSGTDGQSVYKYIAYASDDSGTDFTLTNDTSLDYQAILLSYTAITSPVVTDFVDLWYKRKGDQGTNASYIELPTGSTVQGRITTGIIEQPSGWTINSADQISNPLSENSIDLIIYHATEKEVVDVIVKSKTSDKQTKLIGVAAYGGWEDDDEKNYLCIKSFSETETILGIYILFES